MALHILQLGPYPPPEGGITRNIVAIRDLLRERGHRCSIIATSQSARVDDEPDVYHPRSALALIRALRSIEYDVLHMHIGGDVTRRVLALAFVCTLLARGKCLLTLHSGGFPMSEEAKAASPRSVRGLVFRRFEKVIGVSDGLADVFRAYGIANDRIAVIPPYALQPPDENVKIPDHLLAFCESGSPLLVAVGGLEVDYQPLFLLDAMADILAQFPNARLMIVGDGSLRRDVEEAINKRQFNERILLTGNIEHSLALHLIQRADIMLRTTLFDGDAISIREALFLGTPVIATDTGTRPENVNLIPIGGHKELAAAVTEALDSRSRQPRRGKPDTTNITAVVDLYERVAG